MSRCPARSTYQWLTHKPRASYSHALRLSDWQLVIQMTVWEPRSNLGTGLTVSGLISSITRTRWSVSLGLSQLYVFMCLAYWLLVVVVLGFELYLQFELRFKPSAELYLRTSTKTRIAILVFFNHYLFFTRLLSFACQEALSVYKGSQVSSHLVLISRSVLVLSQPSDISDLVPLHLVSINLLSPPSSAASHIA